jgi:hypothetical protein
MSRIRGNEGHMQALPAFPQNRFTGEHAKKKAANTVRACRTKQHGTMCGRASNRFRIEESGPRRSYRAVVVTLA